MPRDSSWVLLGFPLRAPSSFSSLLWHYLIFITSLRVSQQWACKHHHINHQRAHEYLCMHNELKWTSPPFPTPLHLPQGLTGILPRTELSHPLIQVYHRPWLVIIHAYQCAYIKITIYHWQWAWHTQVSHSTHLAPLADPHFWHSG